MIKNVLEATGLEFAEDKELLRLFRDCVFWLNRGDHPTQSMTKIQATMIDVRREQMRRADPAETRWV